MFVGTIAALGVRAEASVSWSQLTMAPCDPLDKHQKFEVAAPSSRGTTRRGRCYHYTSRCSTLATDLVYTVNFKVLGNLCG